MNTDFRYKNII